MSKEQEHIDKLIKDKLSGRSFGAPPKAFIDDLNIRLDKRNKRPLGFFLFTLFTSLLLCTFLMILIIPSSFIVKVKYNLVNNNEGKTKEILGLNAQLSETLDDSKLAFNNREENNLNSVNHFELKDSVDSKQDVQEFKNEINKDKLGRREGKEKNSIGEVYSKVNDTKSKNSKTKSDQSIPYSKASNIDRQVNEQEDSNGSSKVFNDREVEISTMISAIQLPYIRKKINTRDFFNFKNSVSFAETSKELISVIHKDEKSKVLDFELQLFAGLGFDKVRINNAISDVYSDLLTAQSENEESLNFGIHFNVIYRDLVFGSGLTFAQQREDNDFELKSISVKDSVFISYYDQDVTFDSLNNTVDTVYTPVYDSTQITTEEWKEFEVEQNYSWIQVPIHFGYRFQLKKWAITPSVGVNLGIGVRNKSMKYPNQDFDQFNEYQPVKWTMNLLGNIEVRRQIGLWHVFVRGTYQYGINPVLKSNLFHRSYDSLNAVLGVGYTF